MRYNLLFVRQDSWNTVMSLFVPVAIQRILLASIRTNQRRYIVQQLQLVLTSFTRSMYVQCAEIFHGTPLPCFFF